MRDVSTSYIIKNGELNHQQLTSDFSEKLAEAVYWGVGMEKAKKVLVESSQFKTEVVVSTEVAIHSYLANDENIYSNVLSLELINEATKL